MGQEKLDGDEYYRNLRETNPEQADALCKTIREAGGNPPAALEKPKRKSGRQTLFKGGSVRELAAKARVSKSMLYRAYQKERGITPRNTFVGATLPPDLLEFVDRVAKINAEEGGPGTRAAALRAIVQYAKNEPA